MRDAKMNPVGEPKESNLEKGVSGMDSVGSVGSSAHVRKGPNQKPKGVDTGSVSNPAGKKHRWA